MAETLPEGVLAELARVELLEPEDPGVAVAGDGEVDVAVVVRVAPGEHARGGLEVQALDGPGDDLMADDLGRPGPPGVLGRGEQIDPRQRLGVPAHVVDVVGPDPAVEPGAQQIGHGRELDDPAQPVVDGVPPPDPGR